MQENHTAMSQIKSKTDNQSDIQCKDMEEAQIRPGVKRALVNLKPRRTVGPVSVLLLIRSPVAYRIKQKKCRALRIDLGF